MSDNWCKTCGAFVFSMDRAHHKCPPIWRAWFDDWHTRWDPDDCIEVRARDSGDAAEAAVEEYDSNDYHSIASKGGTVEVHIEGVDPETKKVTRWTFVVEGQLEPRYDVINRKTKVHEEEPRT